MKDFINENHRFIKSLTNKGSSGPLLILFCFCFIYAYSSTYLIVKYKNITKKNIICKCAEILCSFIYQKRQYYTHEYKNFCLYERKVAIGHNPKIIIPLFTL